MAIDTEKSVAHPTTNFLLTPSRGACQHDAAKPKTLYLKPKDRRSRRFNTKDRRSRRFNTKDRRSRRFNTKDRRSRRFNTKDRRSRRSN